MPRTKPKGAEKQRYDVLTWDTHKQVFTPQVGVRRGPWSQMGLRRALRLLRDIGYSANRSDSFVLVEIRPAQRRRKSAKGKR